MNLSLFDGSAVSQSIVSQVEFFLKIDKFN